MICLMATVSPPQASAAQTRVLEFDRSLNSLPIFRDGMSCLTSARSDNGYWAAILQVGQDGSENAKLASQPDYPFERPIAARARLADAEFSLYRANSRTYYVGTSATSFVDALAGEENVVLKDGNREIAAIPFTGMAVVIEALRDCASDIKLAKGTDLPLVQPNPDIHIAEPDLTGPFPPNRGVRPISPERWVSYYNYRSDDIRAGREGGVGFTVTVGADGRAGACRVTRSSGHAELDSYTCALVAERARFDPATNAEGDLVEAQFSTMFQWRIAE